MQALIALPMVLPPVAVGLALLMLLGRRGPLGALWSALGIELVFTWWAAAIAAAVVGFPLLARACEQAFAAVDPRYERLARTLGLSPLQAFLRVTLPLAQRGVLYGALLAFTRALGEFGATALVAGILPGRTETLALGIYSRVQLGEDARRARALRRLLRARARRHAGRRGLARRRALAARRARRASERGGDADPRRALARAISRSTSTSRWNERVAVIFGPSGSGKSTLLEAVLGLLPAARARIQLGGAWLDGPERGVRLRPEQRRLGWVPQDALLFPHLTVERNVRFAAGRGAAARAGAPRSRARSRRSRSATCSGAARTSSRAASASAWRSRARSRRARARCCSTSRSPRSISRCARACCATCCACATSSRSRSCGSRTTPTRRRSPATS